MGEKLHRRLGPYRLLGLLLLLGAAAGAVCWALTRRQTDPLQDEAVKALGVDKYLTLDLGGGVTMKLVLIPARTFLMGSPASESGREDDEGPQHEVTITKPFYMGVTEVTQEQYEAMTGGNPSEFQGAKNPVEMVFWEDAVAFCQAVSRKTGKTVRLPTEAEWEYACRAGTKTVYQWGDDPDDGEGWCNWAYKGRKRQFLMWTWYPSDDGYGATTAPAGSFKPNRWGLYDMHGNVWEWCSDYHAEDYYASANNLDPKGPRSGDARVLRGGSWFDLGQGCRSANRVSLKPAHRYAYYGFRVVVSAGVD